MNQVQNEKYVTLAIVVGFTAQIFTYLLALLLYPPVYSGDIPVFAPKSLVIISMGLVMFIFGSTVMAIKLADEKNILAAAGFTMLAITIGVWMALLFESSQDGTMETFEKSYYVISCSNFLYLPAMVLIGANDGFKKWVRYLGLISALPFLASSLLFLNDYRNFKVLDEISSGGYGLILFTQVMWATNVYQNYRKKKSAS